MWYNTSNQTRKRICRRFPLSRAKKKRETIKPKNKRRTKQAHIPGIHYIPTTPANHVHQSSIHGLWNIIPSTSRLYFTCAPRRCASPWTLHLRSSSNKPLLHPPPIFLSSLCNPLIPGPHRPLPVPCTSSVIVFPSVCLPHSIGNGLWLISDQKEREREEKGRRKLRDTKFFVIQEILGSHVSDRVYVGIKLPRESLSLSLSFSLLPASLSVHAHEIIALDLSRIRSFRFDRFTIPFYFNWPWSKIFFFFLSSFFFLFPFEREEFILVSWIMNQVVDLISTICVIRHGMGTSVFFFTLHRKWMCELRISFERCEIAQVEFSICYI